VTIQRIPDESVIRIAAESGADLALALTGNPDNRLTLMLTLTDEYGYRYRIHLGSSHVREIHDGLCNLHAMPAAELEATVQDLRDAEADQ
jgi:hypothetical protein